MIFNLISFRYLARAPFTAIRYRDRIRGMIGRRFSEEMDAMVFPECGAIHSCFMSQRIDVVFLDRENRVAGLRENLPPWLLFAGARDAVTTIELPPGAIASSETKIGDRINLNMELDSETIAKMRYGAILYSVPPEKAEVKRRTPNQ